MHIHDTKMNKNERCRGRENCVSSDSSFFFNCIRVCMQYVDKNDSISCFKWILYIFDWQCSIAASFSTQMNSLHLHSYEPCCYGVTNGISIKLCCQLLLVFIRFSKQQTTMTLSNKKDKKKRKEKKSNSKAQLKRTNGIKRQCTKLQINFPFTQTVVNFFFFILQCYILNSNSVLLSFSARWIRNKRNSTQFGRFLKRYTFELNRQQRRRRRRRILHFHPQIFNSVLVCLCVNYNCEYQIKPKHIPHE